MKSPFPGMDPFLENPAVFPDFHDAFIAYLREAIQPGLPEPYYAALGRRSWVEISERFIGPDVNVIAPASHRLRSRPDNSSVETATMEVTRPIVVTVPHDEQSETFVEVYTGRRRDRRLVTALEVLSPTNKQPGEKGRNLYLREQAELLDSKCHLVEVDLLRGGTHTTAVPEDRLRQNVPSFAYHVCSHHFDQFEDFLIYPIQLADTLPTISIPLLPGDGDVPVNLQQVFERTYAAGPYHREIDYSETVPPPELTAEQLLWVRKRVGAE
ncbi:MAG: DUF4058 family protein [Planctomycetaceae bacterium]